MWFIGLCILVAAALRAATDWHINSVNRDWRDALEDQAEERTLRASRYLVEYQAEVSRRERERDRRESEARFEERYGGKTAAVVSTVVDKLTTE